MFYLFQVWCVLIRFATIALSRMVQTESGNGLNV